MWPIGHAIIYFEKIPECFLFTYFFVCKHILIAHTIWFFDYCVFAIIIIIVTAVLFVLIYCYVLVIVWTHWNDEPKWTHLVELFLVFFFGFACFFCFLSVQKMNLNISSFFVLYSFLLVLLLPFRIATKYIFVLFYCSCDHSHQIS